MSKIDPFQIMSRRCFLLGTSQALLLSGLGIQLYRLQIQNRSRYEMLSESNRLAVRLLNAPRGRLLDREGIPLAFNKSSFRLIVLAGNRKEFENSLQTLQKLIDLSHLDLKSLLKECETHPHHLVPLVLKEPLSWEEVSVLEVHRPDLIGIAVETGQARFYPLGSSAAHFLGYIGVPAKGDCPAKQPPIPGLRIGKSGTEKILDPDLRGKEGSVSLEINAYRQVMRELESRPITPGKDIHVSIDSRLQSYVANRLEAYESASVVVLDVHTGEILALVSHPSFDPHLFVNGIRTNAWNELQTNPYKPLLNKAINGLYAPGSTIKMAIALAALEKGVIDPSTTLRCWGLTTLNNHRFHCWMHKRGGHGNINCYKAIAQSCDVFFYEVARRTGIEAIVPVLKALGLGENLLPEFRESVAGLVPTPDWKKRQRKLSWNASDTMLTGIGQGYLLTTPLQLAVMAARLATGKSIVPTYLQQATAPAASPLPFSPENLLLMRESMAGVTGDPTGTGFRYRIVEPGLEMAGKTGTSQVRRISLQDREKGLLKTDTLPWEAREHAVFCGYAPMSEPHYAVGLVVEHGGGGGSVATPIARDILKFAQTMDQETPLPLATAL